MRSNRSDRKRKKRNFDLNVYIVLFLIVAFLLLLVYYILYLPSNTAVSSVSVTKWALTYASYPLSILNITPIFNSTNNQLYLVLNIKNMGNSEIGYIGGCTSPLNGIIYPNNTANFTFLKGIVTCNAITTIPLQPNQTAVLSWPYSPKIINVLKNSGFNANLTFSFGFYKRIQVACPVNASNCNTTALAFQGVSENDSININFVSS